MDNQAEYGLPPVLSVEQTAAFMRCDRKTVYDAVRDGELPARRIRKRVVILRDALLSWLRCEERVVARRKG